MIYLASQVSIFMKSVMPDTDMIFSYLKNSEKLKDIDIFDINSTSPLNKVENEKITRIYQFNRKNMMLKRRLINQPSFATLSD